jgi:hypothetical protein
MTEDDLQRVETTLAIKLPASYRAAMIAFPGPAFAGNTDTEIWDDADAVIAFNAELRRGASGGVKPWPHHMFAMGHAGDGSPSAIDLRSPDAAVWWVEKCHLDGVGTAQSHSSFNEWLTGYVSDLRHDSEVFDPDGTPAARQAALAADARHGCLGLVYMIVALVVLSALIVIVARWLA